MDELTKGLYALADDPDARVRFQLALTLGESPGDQELAALSRLARTGADDHWHSLAILTGVGSGPWRFWKMLVEEYPDWFSAPDAEHAWFIEKLAMLAAASRDENDLRESAVSLAQDQLPLYAKMVLLSSLAGKLPAPASDRAGQNVLGIVAEAERAALAPERALAVRLAAVRLLGRSPVCCCPEIRRRSNQLLWTRSARRTIRLRPGSPSTHGSAVPDQHAGNSSPLRHVPPQSPTRF